MAQPSYLVGLSVCLLAASFVSSQTPDPSRFVNFFLNNVMGSGLPLSYMVPAGYFDNIPANLRPHAYNESMLVPQCDNRMVAPDLLDAYMFQTETLLTNAGLNLYDGACWSIALTLLGRADVVQQYEANVLLKHKTLQLANIKADAACKGIIIEGGCGDPSQSGACGLCYGVNETSLQTANAYFFRMIGDIWSFDGTTDVRCPDLGHTWTWNDWRPVTGENAWATLLGPLQVAYQVAKGDVNQIADDSTEMQLAVSLLPGFEAMLVPGVGAVMYAPYNTFDVYDDNIGATVSTENNASLLAGLRALLQILQAKTSSQYKSLIPSVEALIASITKYLLSAYDPNAGFFRQGGRYNRQTGAWDWGSGAPGFAVDCQTWVMSVLGAPLIDQAYGLNAAFRVWQMTKQLGGYQYDSATGRVQGVGFTDNSGVDEFSGEWSFGAVNMLNIFAQQYTDATILASLAQDRDDMRASIEKSLTGQVAFANGATSTAVLYANNRYYIPFGWWANPIPAIASTAWAVMVDKGFNPFLLGGGLTA